MNVKIMKKGYQLIPLILLHLTYKKFDNLVTY